MWAKSHGSWPRNAKILIVIWKSRASLNFWQLEHRTSPKSSQNIPQKWDNGLRTKLWNIARRCPDEEQFTVLSSNGSLLTGRDKNNKMTVDIPCKITVKWSSKAAEAIYRCSPSLLSLKYKSQSKNYTNNFPIDEKWWNDLRTRLQSCFVFNHTDLNITAWNIIFTAALFWLVRTARGGAFPSEILWHFRQRMSKIFIFLKHI